MTAYEALQANPEFAALRTVSTRLGLDPLQVQGPGGNTSIKCGGIMWVKASGTWLADAETRDIFVPVDYDGLTQAITSDDESADDVGPFTHASENPSGLRASIEATVHASSPAKVVLHTHCVATIAAAIRKDAPAFLAEKLDGLSFAFIPYAKPGSGLARAIRENAPVGTDILVLGNHGLVVCGETVAEADSLLREVSARLTPATKADPADASPALKDRLSGTGWMPVPHRPTQRIALDERLLAIADGRTLYPDHLVFLGPGVTVTMPSETVSQAVARAAQAPFPSKLVLVPGHGAAMPQTASRSELALASAFGDVLTRVDPNASVTRLSKNQEAELLDWDAETYRKSLNKEQSTQRHAT